MAVTWKAITYGPAANTADSIPQWDGSNTNVLKDGLTVVTVVGSPGVDTALVTDQGIREGLTAVIEHLNHRHSGTSEGTGSDQEISHGFASAPKRLELIPLVADAVFASLTVQAPHFHVTVTSGKNWAWVAESW